MTITRHLTRAAVMLLLALLSTTSWAQLVQDADGYYLIGTNAEWTGFANGINDGTIAAATNVKLMADITATTMIGSFSGNFNTSKLYSGIFDGNHHTITANINNSSADYVALISCIRNATIKDLTVTGSISGGQHCSGLVSVADGTNTISNVSISATITGSNSHCAGVLGHSYSSVTTINGCIFTGTINGRSSGSTIGVFNGWSGSTGVSINNCVEAGTYTNNSTFNPIAISGLTSYSNNYFVTPAKNSNYVYGTQMSTSIPDNDVYGQLTVAGNTYYIPTVVSGIGDIYELIDDPITPEPIVTYIGNSLTKVTDYTVSYSNNDAVGTATVTITGAGEFSGEKNINFIIYSSDYALIGTAEQLKNFATLVNSGVTNAKGKLIADIDLAGDDDNQWTPIGTDANKYNGTFDGQGFTIKNLYYKQQVEGVGLFGFANSGAYIKNVRVEGTVDNSTNGAGAGNGGTQTCAGGIIGKSYEATVLNCSFSGNVISYSNVGGLVGWGTATIVNCYNEGTVMFHSTANQTGGGVHGYGGSPQLKNCYNVGSVINNGSASYAIGSLSVSGSVSNSYSRSGCVQNGSGASWINAGNTGTVMSLEDMKSEAFVTTLNTNIASLRTTYPDISEWTQDPITNQPVLKIFSSLTQDENGYYLLGSVQDWDSFATLVQTTPTANAKMTADIDLGDDQTMVGTYAVKYQGTFDGQGHTLTINYNTSGMTIESPQQYLGAAPFRDIQNATIRNLHTAGTVTADKIGATGLVGWAYGENTIERCWSSVDIVSSNNTADTFSGFVFRQDGSLLTMNDCYYSGMIQSERKLSHAGFVGHHNAGTAVLNNCLVIFADGTDVPATPPDAGYKCYTFVRNQDKTPIINLSNCYYKTALGTVQGTQATTEELADGTTATALQAGRAEEIWVQDLETNQPMLALFATSLNSLVQDGEGYYLLGSAQDWKDFADGISDGTFAANANARMTADIDLGDDQTMLGSFATPYAGIFDGQGHTLTIHYNTSGMTIESGQGYLGAAPFRDINGATIRNLHTAGSLAADKIGATGMVGWAYGACVIERCCVSVNITATAGDTFSGFVFRQDGTSLQINDCIFNGSIMPSERHDHAGFVGHAYNGQTTVNNCLMLANCDFNGTRCYVFVRTVGNHNGTFTINNSYYQTFNGTSQGTQVTATALADGTVATALQAGRQEIVWVQDPVTNRPMLKIFANSLNINVTGYQNENNRWMFIASPIAGSIAPSDVDGLLGMQIQDNPVLYNYDLYRFNQSGTNGEWENYHQHNETGDPFLLVNGKGYLYAKQNDATLKFYGALYDGNSKDVDLDYDDEATFAGYNLVGNPFVEEATVNMPYYKMNAAGDDIEPETSSAIPAFTGVIVQATTSGQHVTFTKCGGAKSGAESEKQGSIQLMLSKDGTVHDKAIVSFDEGTLLGKYFFNETHAKLYIPQGSEDYAIAFSEKTGEMPLNFKATKSGEYTLSFNTEGVKLAYLHLIDNLTGADVNLLQTPSYIFEGKANDYASRFRLVFSTGNAAEDSFAFFNGSNWVINNEGRATLQVIDIMGRVISTETINGDANVNVNEAAGVYMLRLINGDNVKVQKVVVR